MEMILGLLIPALSGAAGGNIIGKVAGALNGGGLMNTILGAVGGLGAGSILGSLGVDAAGGAEAAAAVSEFDIGTLISGIAGGGAGGAALGGIGGIIKNMMSKG
jgi:hypothetical protein